MRDDEQRFAARQGRDALLELFLVLRIGERGGLVEDDDGRVFQHHARDGDALLLAAGQALAGLARRGIVALRESGDERITLRGAGRGPSLLVRGGWVAEADVLKQRAAEEKIVLRDEADML